jgi:hypothetical protein
VDKLLVVREVIFEIVLNWLKVMISYRLNLFHFCSLLQIEVRNHMLNFSLYIWNADFRVCFDNSSLQHVNKPLRLHNDSVFHESRLWKVRGYTSYLALISTIQRGEGFESIIKVLEKRGSTYHLAIIYNKMLFSEIKQNNVPNYGIEYKG